MFKKKIEQNLVCTSGMVVIFSVEFFFHVSYVFVLKELLFLIQNGLSSWVPQRTSILFFADSYSYVIEVSVYRRKFTPYVWSWLYYPRSRISNDLHTCNLGNIHRLVVLIGSRIWYIRKRALHDCVHYDASVVKGFCIYFTYLTYLSPSKHQTRQS